MKTEKNIFTAFLLNLAFSVFEFVGGIFTGSVAVMSDAIHDMGDAAGIGISYLLEKKSRKAPDSVYTFGYARYSVLGGAVTTLILLLGSAAVIFNAAHRLLNPVPVHYAGMMLFAVVGVCVNLVAAFFTRGEGSVNQRAVNLHMLEDVLGWAVVLVGAVIMRFTHWLWLDPIMSMGVALFIVSHGVKNLREVLDILLEKAPRGISAEVLAKRLAEIDDVADICHLHIWSIDGKNHCATAHVVANGDWEKVKENICRELGQYGIGYITLEQVGNCHEA